MPKSLSSFLTGEPVPPVSSRQFVDLVRAKLDSGGHNDIAISRQWIGQATPSHPFVLHVPVGPELVVPIQSSQRFPLASDYGCLDLEVACFATALVTLSKAERTLTKYVRDVRRAAVKVVAAARAAGLEFQLAGVSLQETYTQHLTCKDWKESVSSILAQVELRQTSQYLCSEVTKILVEEPEHVSSELEHYFADQRTHQARITELDAQGADLTVDGLTLDLLKMHSNDVVQTLRDVRKKRNVFIPFGHDDPELGLNLYSVGGTVTSMVILKDAIWNGDVVWLRGEHVENGLDLIGKTLGGKVDHLLLGSRTRISIDRAPEDSERSDSFYLDIAGTYLFDADTGWIWPQPKRIAA